MKILHILKDTYTTPRNAIVLRSIVRKLTGCQMNHIIIECVNCTSILFKHESKRREELGKRRKRGLKTRFTVAANVVSLQVTHRLNFVVISARIERHIEAPYPSV